MDQSEFYVCPECGSFRECEHDYDDDHHDYSRFTQWTEGAHDLYYEMVSNAEIQPHEEVFNTYGEGLSNARLLVQYGFILDPNDNDILNFDTNEILCLFPSDDASSEVPLFQDADLISYASSFNDSDLIFPSTGSPSESAFCIDSDGKISSQLWIFLLRLLCQNTGCSNLFRTDDLRRPITTQADLEHITQDGRSHITEEGDNELDSACAVMLVEVARAVVRLCEMRKAAIGHPNVIGENLGAMLDVSQDLSL
jgi:SET domain-containing protein 6